jgi:chromosome partitioning protein
MSYIITVAQRKGGVGKTTLAISVAAELRRRSRQVALIDSDPQRSACQWAETGNLQFPVYEIALNNQSVSKWAREVIRISSEHEDVIVDTAPSEEALNATIAASSLVIVPCTPSGLDLEATTRTLNIVNPVRARRQGHPPLILVPNRVDSRTLEGRQLVDELGTFGEVVSFPIGYRTAFVRAFSEGCSVAEIQEGQVAHQEIQSLCDLVEKYLEIAQRLGKN